MHANIGDKPVAWRLSSALAITLPKAVGHLALFWGKVSQHAPGGDVSQIPDLQLESWAGWDGKRGRFAAWVRDSHSTEGVVNEYDEYSGALDVRREQDRKRKQLQRDRERTSKDGHEDGPRDVTRTSRTTIRDDTKRDENLPSEDCERAEPPTVEALRALVVAQLGADWNDVALFLDSRRPKTHAAWLKECLKVIGPGSSITPMDLAGACADALAVETPIEGPHALRAFAEKRRRERTDEPTTKRTHRPSGSDDGVSLLEAGELVEFMRRNRHAEFRASLAPGVWETVPDHQRRAIDATGGTEKILSSMDDKERGIYVAQLSKVLRTAKSEAA